MVLQQPVDAVRLTAFLVGGKRQDEVAIGLVALLLQANKGGDQDGVAFLHVLGATAVEVAILFDKLKGIGGPVRTQRLDHVEVTDKENRLGPARAMKARHQVALTIVRPEDEHIFLGEPGVEQALRHRLCGNRCTAHGIGGVDFNELLEDVARELSGRWSSCASAGTVDR